MDEEIAVLPRKFDIPVVDVANKFPTVSCVPVAIRAVPAEFETIIELTGKDVEFVPPEETGSVPEIVESVVVATHDGIPFARARV